MTTTTDSLGFIQPLRGKLPAELDSLVQSLKQVPDFNDIPSDPIEGTQYSEIYGTEFADMIAALRPHTGVTQANMRVYLRKRVTDPAGRGVPSKAWVSHRRHARGPSGEAVPEQARDRMTTFTINDIYILTHCLGIVTSKPHDERHPAMPSCRGVLVLEPKDRRQHDYLAWVHEQAVKRLGEAETVLAEDRARATETPLQAAHKALTALAVTPLPRRDEPDPLPALLSRTLPVSELQGLLHELIEAGFTGDPERDSRLPAHVLTQAEARGTIHRRTVEAYQTEE